MVVHTPRMDLLRIALLAVAILLVATGCGSDKKNGKLSCDPVSGFIEKGADCDDSKKEVNPDAAEVCNSIDDNCDGQSDEGLEPGLYYKDEDGDGFAATGAKAEFTCKDQEGFVAVRKDCAPKDPKINPDAKEVKNGKDDNCNGEIDEEEGSGGEGGAGGLGDLACRGLLEAVLREQAQREAESFGRLASRAPISIQYPKCEPTWISSRPPWYARPWPR